MTRRKDSAQAQRVGTRVSIDLFLMSNLRASTTGLMGAVAWVSPGEFGGTDAQTGPRIKVMPGTKIAPASLDTAVSVRLTRPPLVLGKLPGEMEKQVVQFVTQNRDTLIAYWNWEFGTTEMLDALKRV